MYNLARNEMTRFSRCPSNSSRLADLSRLSQETGVSFCNNSSNNIEAGHFVGFRKTRQMIIKTLSWEEHIESAKGRKISKYDELTASYEKQLTLW